MIPVVLLIVDIWELFKLCPYKTMMIDGSAINKVPYNRFGTPCRIGDFC